MGGGSVSASLQSPTIFAIITALALTVFSLPFPSRAKDTAPNRFHNTPINIPQSIKNGTYRIVSSIDSSLSLSIGETIHVDADNNPSTPTYNTPNICIDATDATNAKQQWVLTNNNDGSYTIESKSNNGYAINYDVHNACSSDSDFVQSSTLGTSGEYNVMAWGKNGTAAQKWTLKQYTDTNWFAIQNTKSGMYLDVKSGENIPGTNVCGWELNNSAAQKWHIVPIDIESDKTSNIDENITFSLPTEVPCYEKADGTDISPNKSSWQICNLGTKPITLTDVSITDTNNEAIESIAASATGLELETNTTAATKEIANGTGSWTIHATPKEGATFTKYPNKDRLAVIRNGEQNGFDWTIKLNDNVKREITDTKIVLSRVSFNFGQVFESDADETNGKAFAIYSNTDKSLNFYKRKEMPSEEEWFCGKIVSDVYTEIETDTYTYDDASKPITDGLDTVCTTPWYGRKDDILSVSIRDDGIAPKSLRAWFANMLNVKHIDVAKCITKAGIDCCWLCINCRSMTELYLPENLTPCNMSDLLYSCWSLTSDNLRMPGFDTSHCTRTFAAFQGCIGLTHIGDIEGWNTSKVTDFRNMFFGCENLIADLTNWDVSSSESKFDAPRQFNRDAPHITLPKAWSITAFAIYSPDDESLDFYKRAYGCMPSIGDTFCGKTVGEIYTGFEDAIYQKSAGTSVTLADSASTAPWFAHRENVKTVKVIDDDIAPVHLNWWFTRFTALTEIDLSNLDSSRLKYLNAAIVRCSALTDIKLPEKLPVVYDLTNAFYCNKALEKLDLSCLDSKSPKVFWGMCGLNSKLKELILSDQIVTDSMDWCFQGCYLLNYDCTNWDVSNASCDIGGLEQTFANIPIPKAWRTDS